MTFPLLFESPHLFIVDKPSGWLTTPARSQDDPRPVLGRHLQKQLQQQIYPVHRLDFEVSGLTLWAKDPRSHTLAQRWFEDGEAIRKVYEAYSRPTKNFSVSQDFIEWRSKLVRGKRRSFEAAHGKPARTLARVKEQAEFCLWELVALTGRPHQLRFEMAKNGVPILGDQLYGGEDLGRENWLALRAVELDLSALSEEQRLGLPVVCRTHGLELLTK